jgi:hypothetical protein
MRAMNQIASKLFAAAALISLSWVATAQTMPNQSHYQSIGTVNCASSTCHGSITERSSTPVLQNEYTKWLRQDPHTQAYDILNNEQSKKIAQNLRLPKPAYESKECLDCHSHNAPPALRGSRFDMMEGIGCEGCHGPAGKWIQTHVEPNATHTNNVANGMYPTNQPYAVAKLCLSCHMGDATRPITHQIMGAGHPRLSVEVDTFMALQPPHYKIDQDWVQRKGAYDSTKIWAMGQFAAAINLLDLISDPKRNSQGILPELMMFDCHACHSSMKKKKWTSTMSTVPGQARLNDSSLLMIQAIVHGALGQSNQPLEDQLTQQLALMHRISTSPQSNLMQVAQTAQTLRSTVEQLREKIAATPLTTPMLEQVLKQIVIQASSNDYTDYAGAEQAYMSISSVAAGLAQRGNSKIAAAVNLKLALMLKTLANDEKYDRNAFQSELLSLNGLVGGIQ